MTRSLITGGFGFIGRRLALLLRERGDEVVLLDIVSDDAFLRPIADRVTALRGSLSRWTDVVDAIASSRPDRVFHCGAILPPTSEASPQAAFETNIAGTYYVLEASRLFNVGCVVYASSVASYGPDAPRDTVPNESAQHPTSMYGVSKVCSERLGEYYFGRYGLDFRAVRFPAIFGLGRAASSGWTAFTSVAVEESALGRPYAMRVAPDTPTGVLYVRDATRSLADISSANPAQLTRRCYSLHGFVVTARELADAILHVVPTARLTFEPDPNISAFVASIPQRLDDTPARLDWNWRAHYDLQQAVADFVATVRGT